MNITFVSLFNNGIFPDDTMWTSKGAEIVGYSASQNNHIVIDDGMCKSGTGKYLVHIYKPNMANFANIWQNFKYLDNSYTIFEKWVQFL